MTTKKEEVIIYDAKAWSDFEKIEFLKDHGHFIDPEGFVAVKSTGNKYESPVDKSNWKIGELDLMFPFRGALLLIKDDGSIKWDKVIEQKLNRT